MPIERQSVRRKSEQLVASKREQHHEAERRRNTCRRRQAGKDGCGNEGNTDSRRNYLSITSIIDSPVLSKQFPDMDAIDQKIRNTVQRNGLTSSAEIGKALELSVSPAKVLVAPQPAGAA